MFEVDGRWGPWSDWTPCSATCGEGVKFRYRFCDSPAPQGTGKDCGEDNSMVHSCTVSECGQPGKGREHHATKDAGMGTLHSQEQESLLVEPFGMGASQVVEISTSK